MRATKVRWIGLGFCLALLAVGYRVSGQKDRLVPAAKIHAPTPTPDRIILTWSDDPARTASVTWRTDATVDTPVAQIAVAEDGPLFVTKSTAEKASSEDLETDFGTARYHSVRFSNLKPDTPYVYRVGDGANWSDWNQFRTAADGPAPLEFIYVGDAQNDIYSLWSRLIRQGYSDAPKARFILHAGDLINRGPADAEWGEWHQAAGWINRSVPSVPTPGNHEYSGVSGVRSLTKHWRKQFTLPDNGTPGLEESNYFLDIQGVRIVSLNSNEKQAEQADWLDKVLSKNANPWTILTFHHPIFSTARGRDNRILRELWQPVFDKHKVDLVLTGHDHSYGRSNLLTGVTASKNGTVYVVSVSGPKMYNLERQPWMERAAEDTQLYQIIRVNKDVLKFEARTAIGNLYDAFELRKSKGQPNQLVETGPKTPERVRPPAPAKTAD